MNGTATTMAMMGGNDTLSMLLRLFVFVRPSAD